MSRQVDSIHTDELISEMEKHSVVWDSTKNDYLNKVERGKAWISVISRFIPDFEGKTRQEKNEIEGAIKTRWRSIRTCYTRELLKLKNLGPANTGRKQYQHFEQLRFLDGVTRSSSTAVGEEDGETVRSAEAGKRGKRSRSCVSVPVMNLKAVAKNRRKEGREVSESTKKRVAVESRVWECEKDADKMFLLSLVPDLQKVPQHTKLQLKSDILLAISKAQQPLPSMFQPQLPEEWKIQSHPFGEDVEIFGEQTYPRSQICGLSVSPDESSFVKVEPAGSCSSEGVTSPPESEDEEVLSF